MLMNFLALHRFSQALEFFSQSLNIHVLLKLYTARFYFFTGGSSNASLLFTDGNCVGISLETTSGTQLAQFDSLLSELALLKTTEEISKMATSCRKTDGTVGVTSTSTKAEPTWGTTVAGVSW